MTRRSRLNRRSFIGRLGLMTAGGGALGALLGGPAWSNENDPHHFGRASISDHDPTDRPGHGRGTAATPAPQPVADADGAPADNRGRTAPPAATPPAATTTPASTPPAAPAATPAPVTDNDPAPVEEPVTDGDGVKRLSRGRGGY